MLPVVRITQWKLSFVLTSLPFLMVDNQVFRIMQWKLSGILFVKFDYKGRVEPHINESITSVVLFSYPDIRAVFVPERRENRISQGFREF